MSRATKSINVVECTAVKNKCIRKNGVRGGCTGSKYYREKKKVEVEAISIATPTVCGDTRTDKCPNAPSR